MYMGNRFEAAWTYINTFISFLNISKMGNKWKAIYRAAMADRDLGPLLLTWTNFDPSMDK